MHNANNVVQNGERAEQSDITRQRASERILWHSKRLQQRQTKQCLIKSPTEAVCTQVSIINDTLDASKVHELNAVTVDTNSQNGRIVLGMCPTVYSSSGT
jgi:hypothetical protein